MKYKALLQLGLFLFFTIGTGSSIVHAQCSISGLDPTYCIDDAAVTLTGTPGGGTWSGPGMTGDVFDPSDAGVGVHTITYTLPGDEDKYYIKSNIGNPWGSTSNQTAMDNAFGPAGWTLGSFEFSDPATVFSSTTSFVFLEGSDGHALELNTFLVANLALIETWVDEGGCLLLNAAPNEGTDINFGFGGTTLDYPVYSGTVTAVDPLHPAFLGPLTPTATTMTGPYYAHGRILGSGYTNVLVNGGNVILAEKSWGLGQVMVGGMTTSNWHSPAPQGNNFRANILDYLNDLAVTVACTVTQDVEVFDLPTVTATVDDDEICEGESVIFNGGGADTYAWDGGVTNGVSFTPVGTGTVTYTVTGTNTTTTCQNTASVDLTVNPLPTVTANADAVEICLGDEVIFTGGGADSYAWDMGVTDGLPFTPVALGTTTYTVTGTNGATGCQNTASIDVLVHDSPTVTATATPDEICIGESIVFTGGGADTYAWDGGIVDGDPFTPLTAGTFTYTVTGSLGVFGCENTATVDITVHDLPVVTASVDDDEICEGESVIFNGGGADSYVWDLGVTDGVSFTPVGAGTTTYTVTGTDLTTTCENTASVDLTVHALPTVTANADLTEICLGEEVIFTGGGADDYAWDVPGVTDGMPYTPGAAGTVTYTVTGTNAGTGCENTASIDVTVYDNPVVTATATPDEICIGESIIFTGGGADTYAWDGGIVDGDPFTPLTAGTFTYTVIGSVGASGCENTATVDITVHDLPTVTAAVDDDEICEGESVIFNGGGADSYVWDLGVTDGISFTPVGAGTTTYTVTGTNLATTCENTATVDLTVHALPPVTANADLTEICLGEEVVLTGGGADDYIWDVPGVTDGMPYTPAGAGTVTYTVTGTDVTTGCQNSASIDVTVYDNPVVTATATPDEICIGESIIFTGGGADIYTWDGGIVDGDPFTPLTAGTFTYTVTGSVGASGCENTASVDITVHDLPIVTATVDDDEICEGESVIFNGGGADSYVWDLGVTDGVSFSPVGTGTTTYTVTGTDLTTTCENTATVDLTVHASPTVTANADATEICLGESVTLSGGGADDYSWDIPGVTDGMAYTPMTLGTLTYTVTGTNTATGCQSTASIDVTVIECEDVAAIFYFDENICIGDCITFVDSSLGTIIDWNWEFPSGSPASSNVPNPTVCFDTVGIYTITLTVTNMNGTTSSTSETLTVNELPVVNALNDTIIDIGGTVNLIAVTGGVPGVYNWTPDEYIHCDNCPITTAKPIDSTTYTVNFIDENGCTANASVMVLVNYMEGIGVPTAFSPNDDGFNDILYVKGYSIENMSFAIYNRFGELVFRTDDQNIGWDGKFMNRDENPGVFTWVLEYNLYSGKKGMLKGNTTLIR